MDARNTTPALWCATLSFYMKKKGEGEGEGEGEEKEERNQRTVMITRLK